MRIFRSCGERGEGVMDGSEEAVPGRSMLSPSDEASSNEASSDEASSDDGWECGPPVSALFRSS